MTARKAAVPAVLLLLGLVGLLSGQPIRAAIVPPAITVLKKVEGGDVTKKFPFTLEVLDGVSLAC